MTNWRVGAADLVAVALFVVIGRASHAHGESPAGIVSTAWPFMAGVVVGWLAAARVAGGLTGRRAWALVTLATVAVGMTLRVVAGQGTAVSFIVVALVFLGAFFAVGRAALYRR